MDLVVMCPDCGQEMRVEFQYEQGNTYHFRATCDDCRLTIVRNIPKQPQEKEKAG